MAFRLLPAHPIAPQNCLKMGGYALTCLYEGGLLHSLNKCLEGAYPTATLTSKLSLETGDAGGVLVGLCSGVLISRLGLPLAHCDGKKPKLLSLFVWAAAAASIWWRRPCAMATTAAAVELGDTGGSGLFKHELLFPYMDIGSWKHCKTKWRPY